MIELNLLTYGGVAAISALVVQFLVKPALKSYTSAPWYSFGVNGLAAALGVVFAFGGALIGGSDWSASSIAEIVVVGLFGGLTAIGGYEGVKNVIATVRPSS